MFYTYIVNCSDSLFETGISSSSSGSKFTQSNSQPPDTYKFSTFGYNNATSPYAPIHHHQGQQQEQQQQRTAPHYYRCATNRDCYENRVAAQFDAAQNVVQYAHVPFASSTPSAPPSTTATLSSHDEIDADISLPPPPPPPSSHTPVNNAHNFNAPKKKTEESRIMLEIRSSAPDVIIMTASHWIELISFFIQLKMLAVHTITLFSKFNFNQHIFSNMKRKITLRHHAQPTTETTFIYTLVTYCIMGIIYLL